MRHTNSDVFETGGQTQAGLQLFRSRRGSRHNRQNFLFKWRVPNSRLQGLGVFNLDSDKAEENELRKKNGLYILAWTSEQEEKRNLERMKNRKKRSRCSFVLFTTYCLLETARPFLTSISPILVPGKSSPISFRHTGTGLVSDSE